MKITCMICGGIISNLLKSCICWILKDLPNTKTLLSLACPALEFFQDLVLFVKQDLMRRIFWILQDIPHKDLSIAKTCLILKDLSFKTFQDLSISQVIYHLQNPP